jgi:hypothetical protein
MSTKIELHCARALQKASAAATRFSLVVEPSQYRAHYGGHCSFIGHVRDDASVRLVRNKVGLRVCNDLNSVVHS